MRLQCFEFDHPIVWILASFRLCSFQSGGCKLAKIIEMFLNLFFCSNLDYENNLISDIASELFSEIKRLQFLCRITKYKNFKLHNQKYVIGY